MTRPVTCIAMILTLATAVPAGAVQLADRPSAPPSRGGRAARVWRTVKAQAGAEDHLWLGRASSLFHRDPTLAYELARANKTIEAYQVAPAERKYEMVRSGELDAARDLVALHPPKLLIPATVAAFVALGWMVAPDLTATTLRHIAEAWPALVGGFGAGVGATFLGRVGWRTARQLRAPTRPW